MSLDQNCLFCRIVEKKITAKILYEDAKALAFEDINPQAPVHILIVPKTHLADIQSMQNGDREDIGHLFLVAQMLADQKGLQERGYRLVMNNGRGAGQTVFHVHVHLLSGRSFSWPPG